MAVALSFVDHFNGTHVSLSFGADESPPSPLQQHEIVRPLQLVNAAAWFFRFFARRWPGFNGVQFQQLPPLGYMSAKFSPATRVRVMFSCVATACRRLATSPGGMYVDVTTTLIWPECVMDRVTRGYVRKVQQTLADLRTGYFNEGCEQLSSGRPSYAARCFQQAVDGGHAAAHAALAFLHYGTYVGIPNDPGRIHELACAGARMGCIHSKGALAACFMEGVGAAKEYRRGVELAIESAAAGSMYGQHTLAVAHREGVDSSAPRDDARAAVLFQLAAEQGEVHSLGWLAMMHLGGLGVPKSTDEALHVFRRAAAIGYQPAIRMLASLGQPWCE